MTDNEKKLEAAEKIRAALKDQFRLFPSHATKFSLQRWLEEYDYDADAVIPKLSWTLNALETVGAHRMDTSSIEVVNHFLENFTPMAPFFPGGLMSYDRNGNVIFIQPFARLRPAILARTSKISALYVLLMHEAYATHQLICAQEEKRNERMGQIAIIDMNGFSRQLLFISGLKIFSEVYRTLQFMFPGVSKKLYVINANSLLIQSAHLVEFFLTNKTKDGFEFLDHNWQSRLKTELGEENILPHWGGIMNARIPTGGIRMGGEITREAIDLMKPPRVEEAELKRIKVPRRHCSIVNANVTKKGQVLKWYFTCDGGEIEFYIQKDGREVFPRLLLSTKFFPEFGELKCEHSGLYEICFDNKNSKLWSKTVTYKIDLCTTD